MWLIFGLRTVRHWRIFCLVFIFGLVPLNYGRFFYLANLWFGSSKFWMIFDVADICFSCCKPWRIFFSDLYMA